MKKCAAVLAVWVLAAVCLAGCGDSYEAVDSTVFVQKDGTVISTDIELFNPASYDERGLRSYVEQAIAEYTAENGADSVKLAELTFEDGKAKLSIEYASVKDYSRFNGIEMFSGSVAEALAAGYRFEGEFAECNDGELVPCDPSAFLNGEGYKVVIIKANTNVHVKGKVKYTSVQNVALLDERTVAISEAYAAQEDMLAGEQEQPAEEEEIIDVMTEPESADEGSIDDDEFVLDGEEEVKIFVFEDRKRPRPEIAETENKSYTNVYTYIIYK